MWTYFFVFIHKCFGRIYLNQCQRLLKDQHCVHGVHDVTLVILDRELGEKNERLSLFDRDTNIWRENPERNLRFCVVLKNAVQGSSVSVTTSCNILMRKTLSWWRRKLPGLFGLGATDNVLYTAIQQSVYAYSHGVIWLKCEWKPLEDLWSRTFLNQSSASGAQ